MNRYQRKEQQKQIADFLESKRVSGEWDLFAFTVVFHPQDRYNFKERFESEYRLRLLPKFRRRIESRKDRQATAIPYEHLFYYERTEKSNRRIGSRRSPFHIHALIPVRQKHSKRIWDAENQCINARLSKDLQSFYLTESFLLEPVKDFAALDWIRYISKSKEFLS